MTNRYIVSGKGLLLIEEKDMSKYEGKFVKLRSPMYCKDDNICSKCAGELFYKLGMRNVGLVSNVIGTTITNLSMKAFHDTSITMKEIDPFEYIS